VALRKLRKRDVKKMLTEKAGGKEKRPIPKKKKVNIKKRKITKRK
jgi:hypothetical protein